MESMHQPIIPGLPDDLGIRCLAMLSHGYHGVMEAVSKRWRDVMRSVEYANCKARHGWCGDWLFVLICRCQKDQNQYQWIAYDPEADRWHPLPPLPSPHWHRIRPTGRPKEYSTEMLVLGCHCVYNKFLVIGGIYRGSARRKFESNEVFQFDPFKKEWSRVTSMRTSRSWFASCAMDGKIYVAGGDNADHPYPEGISLAEVYDPSTDKWEDLPPMPEPVMSRTGIAYKGKFHVIDQYVDEDAYADDEWSLRSQIHVFDPLSRSWHVKHENDSPSLDQVAVADDQVYSMNGSGTLERRGAAKDEWHIVGAVPPLYDSNGSQLREAHGYGLASLGHELYAMGGVALNPKGKGMVFLDRVRVCDPRCSPLVWRETRPMCWDASGYINGWASLKQQ